MTAAVVLLLVGAGVFGVIKLKDKLPSLTGLLPSTASSAVQQDQTAMETPEVAAQEVVNLDYDPSVSSLNVIPGSGESIVGFTLITDDVGYKPSLTDEQSAAIQAVLDEYAPNDRTVSFVFIDLNTGSGYAYNPDAEVYSASSIKAHLASFACQDQIESGNISLSSIRSYAEDAVLWSDNDQYYRLRRASNGYGDNNAFDAWVAGLGLDPSVSEASFPYYSARESAQLWMSTYLYFQTGSSELVDWLKGLFSGTNVSMIRSGIAGTPVEEGEDASISASSPASAAKLVQRQLESSVQPDVIVYNKAGWISGSSDNAVNDAGIIVAGDDAYLMSILTSAPDSSSNRQLVADLASALWSARGSLQP